MINLCKLEKKKKKKKKEAIIRCIFVEKPQLNEAQVLYHVTPMLFRK